jgi:asparagine N-glycosylation enzyme membrane subunit Stt3
VILVATLVQRRFAYYLAVNMAVLSAYISWQIIWYAGLRKLAVKPEVVPAEEKTAAARSKKKKPAGKKQDLTIYYAGTIAAIIVVFFTVFYFNITKSVDVAKPAPYAPSNGWEESLRWMKDNTPEPLGTDDAYNNLYTLDYKYPASAYSVTSWWDYGYWITRTAHRIPSANPSQAPVPITNVANLFLSADKAVSDNISKTLGSSYIIADYSLVTTKLWAVVDWAKQDPNKYFSYYYVLRNGSYSPVQLLKPDFYRTLVVRLYSFDGKAVADGKPMVITYEEKTSGGTRFRAVVKYEEFPSYKAAQDFIAAQKSGNYDIVSASPFVSPIPLPAVTDYKLVYSSRWAESYSQNATIPEIKIFERIP